MADSNEVRAIENISSEVDSSQVKILISSQCIKAQTFLFDKLRKQSERQKEICNFIRSGNLKLETEVKLAEQEIKSFNIATETIKLGNLELNKEYLWSKEKKAEVFQRTKAGKKKYEALWSTSKKRYETIPTVQKLIQVKNKNQTVQANITALINDSKQLVNQIKMKKIDLEATDRARIIEFAKFIVQERPQILKKMNENRLKLKEVLTELEVLTKEDSKNNVQVTQQPSKDQKPSIVTEKDSSLEDSWSNLSKTADKDTLVLPTLHLQNNDLDILSVKLDQIKKVDLQNTTSVKKVETLTCSDIEETPHKKCKKEEKVNEHLISSYFDINLEIKAGNDDENLANKNYSQKKLIYILEDIKLDKTDTFKILNNLGPTQLQETKYIHRYEKTDNCKDELNKSLEIEEIKETDLTPKRESEMVDPPTQFLDGCKTSQETKTVSLNVSIERVTQTSLDRHKVIPKEIVITKSQEENMFNNSTASEESYTAIKEMLLKKNNLDLSPQFVYSKNTLVHKNLKQHGGNVTSKFFETQSKVCQNDEINQDNIEKDRISKNTEDKSNPTYDHQICSMQDDNNIAASSPKGQLTDLEGSVSGFLFNHGPHGIPESLNVSTSTTAFEDSEDFPHCFDSSLLLSPKADIPTAIESCNNNEVTSQEVPNFLAGFRKTGLSFFGGTSSDSKPDSSGQQQSSSFNFTFGNEEKKGRGGLFNMFH